MDPHELNYTKQLVEYLRKNLKKGYTQESLKWALINQGHSRLEIDKAFKKVEREMVRQAPVLKTRPTIKYEVVDPVIYKEEPKRKNFWGRMFS